MSEFHFLRPYWFLALLPLAILLWQLWHRKFHNRSWRAVCDPRLLPYLLTNTEGGQKRWPIIVSGLMALLVILALAGPVWEKLKQPVFREESALVIVLDLSRSMDAADVQPTRLARAQLKVVDILRRRKEGQTALLVYAADPYTVSPLTEDSNTIVSLVKSLSTSLMPVQGSKPGKALQRATQLLKQAGATHGNILLITDGINASQATALAGQVTSHGYQLSVLGVGTAQGAPIAIAGGGFLKDRSGDIVVPKLDAAALAQVARLGGGRYHTLTTDSTDLNHLLAGIKVQRFNAQRKATKFNADHWQEQGPWLLLLVLPFAALAFRKGYLVALIVILLPVFPAPANAMEWSGLWQRPDQTAARILQQSKSPKTVPSADVFHDPEWKASAEYRAGHYQQAVKALQGIDKPDALYNKGNALAKMGKLQDAIDAYDQALKKDPGHADAKYNRKLVQQRLKRQQKANKSKQDKNQSPRKNQKGGNKKQQKNAANQQNKKPGQSKNQQQGKNKEQDKNSANQQKKEPGKSQDQQQADSKQQKKDASNQQNKEPGQAKNQADAERKKAQQAQRDMKPQQKAAQKPDQNKMQQAQQAGQQTDNDAKNPRQHAIDLKEQNKKKEMMQANEQWLRRIPDDPGGLLRRKFQYEHQRQQRRDAQNTSNDNGQPAW